MTDASPASPTIDRRRYRRIVRFFTGVFARFILWEVVLRRVMGQRFVERSATERWQRVARRYRVLAVDLGGVLIKLGQFMSVRVDVLPPAVTSELAGLQDEVPAEPLDKIQALIEAEYGQPLSHIFRWFSPTAEAAASLAQVHRAQLLTGDDVAVKIQRPGIGAIVETDLLAIGTAMRMLKRYRSISQRVDLDRLYAEFSRTTRAELDFEAEGENAERFAENFAQDPCVRIPRIYTETSTQRVLVMENMVGIKIGDFEALEQAGVDRKEVAKRLFDTYLQQVFVHNFVHADPHPGNLFVQPLVPAPGQPRPFRLVFLDFGMVATIPEGLGKNLRNYLMAFATRDVNRMVRAFQDAGFLLPGADLERLEQVEGDLLDRYSGLTMRQAREQAMSEWQDLAREYRDILYEMPFQFPANLLFVGRAISILFGMASSLNPDFDLWQSVEPFARQMVIEEARRDWRDVLGELEKGVRLALSLPGQADRFFGEALRGELSVQTVWSPEAMRAVRRVESAVNKLTTAVVFAALLLAAMATYVVNGGDVLSYILFALAAVALLATLFRH
jgi:predicted unusual protein kinase regulating ubiquinone biosynthesis (AarF/ABC1/UbiB family)